jgi:hypothetical protein
MSRARRSRDRVEGCFHWSDECLLDHFSIVGLWIFNISCGLLIGRMRFLSGDLLRREKATRFDAGASETGLTVGFVFETAIDLFTTAI